jgi:hypothetical protein
VNWINQFVRHLGVSDVIVFCVVVYLARSAFREYWRRQEEKGNRHRWASEAEARAGIRCAEEHPKEL